jgi:hypothetical protein
LHVIRRAGDKQGIDVFLVVENRAVRQQGHIACLHQSVRLNRQQPHGVVALAWGLPVRLQESVEGPGNVQRLRILWNDDCDRHSRHFDLPP